MTELRRITRALLSVSDKTGLVEFARALAEHGVELVSTGGTRKALAEAGLKVLDVSELTGFPEMMDGRVKTLHPKVHGGLLGDPRQPGSRRGDAGARHPADRSAGGQLYPFEATVAKGADFETCIENIDIGGPAMIRAAAKNHADVAVVVDAGDYAARAGRARRSTAARPRWRCARSSPPRPMPAPPPMTPRSPTGSRTQLADPAPGLSRVRRAARRAAALRREPASVGGVLPHAASCAPASPPRGRLQGKQLSYNNINDTDAAFECVAEFDPKRTAACVIVKHANPCGVAEGASLLDAYRKALACDPVSAFGGIVAVNRPLDAEAARAITEIFTEVIIAPDASEEAIAIVGAKKNLRLLVAGGLPDPRAAGIDREIGRRRLAGAVARQRRGRRHGAQGRDQARADQCRAARPRVRLPRRQAREVEHHRLCQGRRHRRHRRRPDEPHRFRPHRRAQGARMPRKAAGLTEPLTKGSVVASDAFFPFADGLLVAIEAGATAVIQPGGSVRDDEVIKAADDHGIAMVFTGTRHFRH